MERRRNILGWIALGLSTLVALLWAFWGTLEAFHEGWWAPTLGGRLLQTLLYLMPMAACLVVGVLAVAMHRVGALIYFLFGCGITWLIFSERWPDISLEAIISWLPVTVLVVGIGVLWWFGRPTPRRLAYAVLLGVPLLACIVLTIGPAYRVSTRHTDVSPAAQLVEGNGVALIWAPAGPGWVQDAQHACNWYEAMKAAAHLSPDGLTLLDEPQYIWRLPTVDEAARSMARHGKNCRGYWDAEAGRTVFAVTPDKEPPLWDPFKEIIYWWTSTEEDEEHAWIVVYDGKAWSRRKAQAMGSMGFRAVKEPGAGGQQ